MLSWSVNLDCSLELAPASYPQLRSYTYLTWLLYTDNLDLVLQCETA
jgi:hypothetical protein